MGLGLGLGAAAILWVADQLSLERQRAQIEGLVALSADRLADMARRATHDAMLRNDADGVRRVVANIGAQEGVTRIRIYNKEGRVRVSSLPAEEGTLVDKRSDECIACHAGAQPKAGLEREDRIRMLRAPDGERDPRHHHPDLQRAGVHGLPRPPGVAARARRPRRAPVDGPGRRRWSRASERQLTYGLVATGARRRCGCRFLLLWALRAAPGQAAARAPWTRAGAGDLSGARARALAATRWASSAAPGTR